MKYKLLAVSILVCATCIAGDQEAYLCITDKVTGFAHNEATGGWDRSSFLPGERFLVSAIDGERYRIERLDDELPWVADCRLRDDIGDDSFTCESGASTVHFNRKTRLFTAVRHFGYWTGSTDSLSMSLGSCAPTT